MVKIPSMEDLRKASAGLVDSIKSGIEASKKDSQGPVSDDAVVKQLQVLRDILQDVHGAQASQAALIKKLETQLAVLAKLVETSKKPGEEPKVKKDL